MRASIAYTMSRSVSAAMIGAWLAVGAPAPACANVITDWDEKAIAAVAPLASRRVAITPYAAYRMMGMVHAAMFDAVNSIERRYRPYLVQLPADPATSKEAAAAAAAAAVLATIDEKTAAEMKAALADYLASIPDGAAKSEGVKLGEAVAAKVLEARANDGSDAPDDYRPRTTPGVYVPTPIMRGPMWPSVKPFAMASASQFRPGPPVALDSKEWATDFNELKDYGGQNSAKRTAQQTETARFWLVGPASGLSSVPTPARDRKADGCRRQRAIHGARGDCDQRRDYRRVGCQVPLQFLATDHGNSQRRYRWQPGHRS